MIYCIESEWVYVVATIISLLGATSVIWFLREFVKARDKLKADKRLYTSVLVFFILIAITLISWGTMNLFSCIIPTISAIMSWIGRLGFTFQLAMILWLLFYRLIHIFEGSAFALEYRTKCLFRGTYLLLIGGELSVVALLATPLHRSIGTTIVMGSVFFCAFVYITALVSLMVYKLITIAKHEKLVDNHQTMVPIVTKVFILSLTPIIAIFWIGLSAVVDNLLHMQGTSTRVLQVTNFTAALCANFYSMLFGFNHFNGYYTKVCGSCHRCCENICSKKVDSEPMAKTIQTVKSLSDIELVVPSQLSSSANINTPASEPEPTHAIHSTVSDAEVTTVDVDQDIDEEAP